MFHRGPVGEMDAPESYRVGCGQARQACDTDNDIRLDVSPSMRPLRTTLHRRAALVVLVAAAAACGDSTPRETAATVPVLHTPFRDSLRAKAVREFAARPDTLMIHVDSERTLGSSDAPVSVTFVGHLQCARCTNFLREVLPVLRREYVESGRVRFAYLNARASDTSYNARFAAHAAYCAALAGKFWPMVDSIAATREEWAHLADPQPRFDSLAVRLGAKPAVQAKCTVQALMSHTIKTDEERAAAAGISTLPTLIIGTDLVTGDLPLKRVRELLDEALAKKR